MDADAAASTFLGDMQIEHVDAILRSNGQAPARFITAGARDTHRADRCFLYGFREDASRTRAISKSSGSNGSTSDSFSRLARV